MRKRVGEERDRRSEERDRRSEERGSRKVRYIMEERVHTYHEYGECL